MHNVTRLALLGPGFIMVSACAEEQFTATNSAALTEEMVFVWPDELVIAGEFPSPGNECRALGSSAAVDDFAVAGATLVACPSEWVAKSLPGKVVGKVKGVSIVAVPEAKAS